MAATSDHMPGVILINVEDIPMLSSDGYDLNTDFFVVVDWSLLSKEHIAASYADTNTSLSNISLPSDAIMCSDVNCNDWNQREDISSVCGHVGESFV